MGRVTVKQMRLMIKYPGGEALRTVQKGDGLDGGLPRQILGGHVKEPELGSSGKGMMD